MIFKCAAIWDVCGFEMKYLGINLAKGKTQMYISLDKCKAAVSM